MTKGDKIRKMSNEDLAGFLFELQLESFVAGEQEKDVLIKTEKEWLDWLLGLSIN